MRGVPRARHVVADVAPWRRPHPFRTLRAVAWRLSAAVAGTLSVSLTACAVYLLAGCVVTASAPPPRAVVVSGPPPAPLGEPVAASPPPPGAVWVDGYWHWTGMHYAWIPGHYEVPPPGAVWGPPSYVANEGAYYYEAGGWQRGGPPVAPAPRPSGVPPAHANALRE